MMNLDELKAVKLYGETKSKYYNVITKDEENTIEVYFSDSALVCCGGALFNALGMVITDDDATITTYSGQELTISLDGGYLTIHSNQFDEEDTAIVYIEFKEYPEFFFTTDPIDSVFPLFDIKVQPKDSIVDGSMKYIGLISATLNMYMTTPVRVYASEEYDTPSGAMIDCSYKLSIYDKLKDNIVKLGKYRDGIIIIDNDPKLYRIKSLNQYYVRIIDISTGNMLDIPYDSLFSKASWNIKSSEYTCIIYNEDGDANIKIGQLLDTSITEDYVRSKLSYYEKMVELLYDIDWNTIEEAYFNTTMYTNKELTDCIEQLEKITIDEFESISSIVPTIVSKNDEIYIFDKEFFDKINRRLIKFNDYLDEQLEVNEYMDISSDKEKTEE